MPLVAYETSDDEDPQGDEKLDSQPPQVMVAGVSVPGKGFNQPSVNHQDKFLPNHHVDESSSSSSSVTNYLTSGGDDFDTSLSSKRVNNLEDDDDLGSLASSSKLLGKLPGIGKKLPAPSPLNVSLSDIVVVDKKSKRIKVVIPSIDELDYVSEEEEEEVGPKRKIIPAGGCSLSSFLPKPKNSAPRLNSINNLFSNSSPLSSSSSSSSSVKSSVASLVPHSVSRPKTNIPPPPKRPQNVPVQLDDGDSHSIDFFSLGDVSQSTVRSDNHLDANINKIIPIVVPKPETESTFNEMMMRKLETDSSNHSTYYNNPQSSNQPTSSSVNYHPSTADINDPDYKKFIASKFGEETADQINIVEVNVGSYLANDTELIRSISMESGPKSSKGPVPSALAKRKNQITYLAYQAKQRELDLKNEAANNRFTKSQTRAKYGF